MDSVYLYDRWYGQIPSAGWDEVTSQTEWVCDHWDQPDEGIGETRGGWSLRLKAFVQSEGSDVVDAAVLLMPLVKFISPTDPH
jgi:GH15 family glucan-1,4-alpha-glucosidase